MSIPDFRSPQPRTHINRFPVRFRKDVLDDEWTLWVPQRITRNRQSKGWRIIINHADGVFRDWVPDAGKTPLESLQDAWLILVRECKGFTSSVTQSKRERLPGRKRMPEIDSGVDGVLITRRHNQGCVKRRSKGVSVVLNQRVMGHSGKSISKIVHIIGVSESTYLDNPKASQTKFERALCLAAAIRAKYLRLYAEAGGPVAKQVTKHDVGLEDIPSEPRVKLDLAQIFDTF